MTKRSTKQLRYWEGEFGNAYLQRNSDPKLFAKRKPFFKKLLDSHPDILSVLEVGSNIGGNLNVLHSINLQLNLTAIEPNAKAAAVVKRTLPEVTIYHQSIFDCDWHNAFDLVFTCGVLIHIANQDLKETLSKIYNASKKYILTIEYYSPRREQIIYRGLSDALFKRPYNKEWQTVFPKLQLIESGKRIAKPIGQDEPGRWWLFKKPNTKK